MINFTTENSTYEVNLVDRLIRRLDGTASPTPYQGMDGEWQSYTNLYGLAIGRRAEIRWDDLGKCTTTSIIKTLEGVVVKCLR